MKAVLLAFTLGAMTLPAFGEITLYEHQGFQGRSVTFNEPVVTLEWHEFANRASSAVVRFRSYDLCDSQGFEGRCITLSPGRYPNFAPGLNDSVISLRPSVAAAPQAYIEERRLAPPPPVPVPPPPVVAMAGAEITLFGREGFQGRSFITQDTIRNLERHDFNDRASSAIVRGGRFQLCDGRGFEGRCVVLRPGEYPSLAAMGLDDAVTSVRPVEDLTRMEERRVAPPPPLAYDYRRRRDERLFEADVVAVRAVYGQADRRCWIEREQVRGSDANAGAAIAGAIIGGILGHQVGSGRGNDAATVAGAVAGAAIGANTGGTTYSRDVQRCSRSQASGPPLFWDVTYRFRGVDRYVQLTNPPGRTITVNRDGEPREG